MLNEEALRRSEFRQGLSVLLADGQDWTLPMPVPPDRPPLERPVDRDTAAILRAVQEAEDRNELLRAELALGDPPAVEELPARGGAVPETPRFDPSSPTLAATQEAFHRLAMAYLRRLEPGPAVAVDDGQARSGGLLRPLIHALDRLTGRRPLANPVNPISGPSH